MLRVHQSLWAMPDVGPAEAAEVLLSAGFAGAALRCVEERALLPAVEALSALGLGWVANCVPRGPGELAAQLRLAARHGAEAVTVVALFRLEGGQGAARDVLSRWLDEAGEAGVGMALETHRASFAEDGFRLARLLDALPALRLTADLTHLLLGHGIKAPFTASDLAMIERLLSASDALHLRVSSSEQAQLGPRLPQHAAWLERHEAWWRSLFSAHAVRRPGRQPAVVAELGPPGSGFPATDAAGLEITDRFADAVFLKDVAQRIWMEGGHA